MGWNREYGGNLPKKYLHELIAQNFSLANDNGWKIIEIQMNSIIFGIQRIYLCLFKIEKIEKIIKRK